MTLVIQKVRPRDICRRHQKFGRAIRVDVIEIDDVTKAFKTRRKPEPRSTVIPQALIPSTHNDAAQTQTP